MNRICAKCNKTAYPAEQLSCLDKYWHKGCFKCTTCGMTLTMKNYKGYDKLPYCNAHYPTTRFTTVADTPENRRIAKNTQNQSNVVYHKEFERQKGSKTSVADDPEVIRIKQNTANQSNVAYWGVKEQRNVMEQRRPNEPVDDVVARRQPGKISDYDPAVDQPSPYNQRSSANVVYDSQRGLGEIRQPGGQRSSTHSYAPFSYGGSASTSPPSSASAVQHRNSGSASGPNRNSYGESYPERGRPGSNRSSGGGYGGEQPPAPNYSQQPNRSSSGYEQQRPYSYGSPQGNPPPAYGNSQSPRNSSGYRDNASSGGGGGGGGGYQRSSGGQYMPQIQGARVQPGSIADYDPMNDRHSSIVTQQQQQRQQNTGYQQQQQQQHHQQQHQFQPPPQSQPQPPPEAARMPPVQPQQQQQQQIRYRAMYDYTAADDDEVSFVDGDLITNCEIIDDGWMTGTVMRTGHQGMLPSNYVERA